MTKLEQMCESKYSHYRSNLLELAARQALEALEEYQAGNRTEFFGAITALREALGYCIDEGCPHHGTTHECTNPLAEQVKQEPVAWMNDSTPSGVFTRHKKGAENFGCTIPLYAAPVRTKYLTDEEKQFYVDKWERTTDYPTVDYLIDAVIAADREKNK